jgi:hypothetical protein
VHAISYSYRQARQLADAQRSSKPGNVEAQQQQLRKEFETLLSAMSKGNDMLDKDELKRLKEAAFGPQTFWVRPQAQSRDRVWPALAARVPGVL